MRLAANFLENVLIDIMEYAEENDIPGLFLLIDFEKAFDSISWNFLNNIYGYNFSICCKELITPLYFKKFTQNPNLFEN
jgi:hypothetical protein